MAPAKFQSSIAHQIGGVRQLWIAQITPDIIPEIWQILFARSCAKCARKRPMRVSASDSSSSRPVDSTARTESNSLAISLEWLEDCVLQFWCAKIHRGLRKTGPPVTALFVCGMENEARRAPTVLQILAMAARWALERKCFSRPSWAWCVSRCISNRTSRLQTKLQQSACGSDGNKTTKTRHSQTLTTRSNLPRLY